MAKLSDWTFEDVVAENQKAIIETIASGGDFKKAVWQATELTARWRYEKTNAEKKE